MISTGKRMFKGYSDYDQCLRLIFDWETTGLDVKKDRIEQFGIRFNRPVKYKGEYMDFQKTYRTEGNTKEEKDASELKNIDTFLRIIYTFRPDIITAHNGEAFDWDILIGACERLGTSIEEMSKKYFNGMPITKNKRETILKLGGEIETYHQTIVPGTIVTDSFALFTGMLVGKHKLAPEISPKKTIEGAVGGALMGTFVATAYYVTVINPAVSLVLLILATLLLSVVGQIGDLAFSSIKRYYGKKDFSDLIPGHGGILDRFDSVVFVAMAFVILFGII
jgi:hypothetical protein